MANDGKTATLFASGAPDRMVICPQFQGGMSGEPSMLTNGGPTSRAPIGDPFPAHLFDRQRFEAKTIAAGDCLIWTGAKSVTGYGRFKVGQRLYAAHRLALWVATGEMPNDREALHDCDNPSCVNAAHLRWGTHADNMNDAVVRGRRAGRLHTHCPQGHAYQVGNVGCSICKKRADAERQRRKRAGYYARGLNSRGKPSTPEIEAEIARLSGEAA